MIEVIREQIVPRLEADVPNQPTPEQLKADPRLCRLTLVFDREVSSPAFFRERWEKRIACQTYRKQPYEPWPTEEFADTPVRLKNGTTVIWRLAERGVLLGVKESEQIWLREVRQLTERGHRTAVVGTRYFGALVLKGEIETDNGEEFLSRKQALQEEIQQQEARVEELKGKRREQDRKIPFAKLPEADRFDQLSNRSKHFIDTIKIIADRAETALVRILREKIQTHHRDDARSLARQIFKTEANLIPDSQAKTLTVEIHGLSTPRDDLALEHLCAELTATETNYPGTELRLIYRKVGRKVSL